MHSLGEGLLPECSVGDPELRRLKLKYAWQLTPCLYVLRATDHERQAVATGSTNFDHGH